MLSMASILHALLFSLKIQKSLLSRGSCDPPDFTYVSSAGLVQFEFNVCHLKNVSASLKEKLLLQVPFPFPLRIHFHQTDLSNVRYHPAAVLSTEVQDE